MGCSRKGKWELVLLKWERTLKRNGKWEKMDENISRALRTATDDSAVTGLCFFVVFHFNF